jgi:hypothetical protein
MSDWREGEIWNTSLRVMWASTKLRLACTILSFLHWKYIYHMLSICNSSLVSWVAVQYGTTAALLFDLFTLLTEEIWSWGSSVSIVSYYRLDERGTGVLSLAEDFSSSLCVQTRSEAHPAPYLMGTGGYFPGIKCGQGMTLTTPSIYSRRQEWVAVIYSLSPLSPAWR